MSPETHPPPPVLRAHNLAKSYDGHPVVDRISFELRRGECFGILGPNGAGKTTTLRMIMGLTPIESGELTIFGLPMSPEQTEVPRRMGVVPQEDNLDTELSVAENLLVHGRFFGLSDRQLRMRIEPLLDFAQLGDKRNQRVAALSGGMKRRLALARSLVAEPELVVLDEPTTGLDPQARHLIWQRLRALKEEGITLLLTTHYMEEAARLCDRLLVMNHGRILDLGSPVELIRRHVEPEVVEVRANGAYGSQGGEAPEASLMAGLPTRVEAVGDTLYCYTAEPAPLMARLDERPELDWLVRPANLEDVFLKLTGRELRD